MAAFYPNFNPAPLGQIAPTPGTPKSILANFPNGLVISKGKTVVVYAPNSNSGTIYLGLSTMVKATHTDVLMELTSGVRYALEYNEIGGNTVDLTKLFVDCDIAGDVAVVSFLYE